MTTERRHLGNLSASYSGTKVATVTNSTMSIWDLSTYSLVNSFPVLFEHGDYRIAISNDGKTVVVGTWRVHGIGAYDTATGSEIWRRKDLKRCHRLTASRDDLRVLCQFEDVAFRSLNLLTGKERTPLRGVKEVHESRFDNVVLHDRDRDKPSLLLGESGKKIAALTRLHWGAPAITFGPGLVCMGGSVTKCFSTLNGAMLWEAALSQELNEGRLACHAIAYDEQQSEFTLVVWPNERGGANRLVRLDSQTGQIKSATQIDAASEFKFCAAGTLLLTSSGTVYRTMDYTEVGVLPFDQIASESTSPQV